MCAVGGRSGRVTEALLGAGWTGRRQRGWWHQRLVRSGPANAILDLPIRARAISEPAIGSNGAQVFLPAHRGATAFALRVARTPRAGSSPFTSGSRPACERRWRPRSRQGQLSSRRRRGSLIAARSWRSGSLAAPRNGRAPRSSWHAKPWRRDSRHAVTPGAAIPSWWPGRCQTLTRNLNSWGAAGSPSEEPPPIGIATPRRASSQTPARI